MINNSNELDTGNCCFLFRKFLKRDGAISIAEKIDNIIETFLTGFIIALGIIKSISRGSLKNTP